MSTVVTEIHVNMTKEGCPINYVGFTVICSLLSGFCVLSIVLLVVIIKSRRKHKPRPLAFQERRISSENFPPPGNDINTLDLQHGVHYSQRHSSVPFPGNPASFARMRHLRESAGPCSGYGIQRNTESFSSRPNEFSPVTCISEVNTRTVIDDLPRSSPVTVDDNISLFDHEALQAPLKDLYCVTDRSFTQTVCGKLLVSIARRVGHKGDVLYLDNMGISLHVPEGAVDIGKSQLIVLVLDWDLTDNPAMQKEESLVSPVVYVGPHGLKLNKSCVLKFRHCAFDPRQIRVMRSETEINEPKSWESMCDRDDVTGSCYMTPDECQLQIDTFTLFTCIQAPIDNVIGKKWLQLAVFACPLRHDANHHQMRIYFLNKTNCALQWAIQNEAKFGGKLVCPEKAFLFDGGELDMITESMYVSEGWELVDDQDSETVAFVKIWHGQCPHISVCFRRSPKKSRSSSGKKLALEINLKLFAYQTTLREIGEMIVVQMFEDKHAEKNITEIQCNHHTKIQVINYNSSNKSEDIGYPHSVKWDTQSNHSDDSSQTGSSHKENHSSPVKVVFVNKNINTVQETRTNDRYDALVVKNIPHNLRKQLVILLEPNRSPIGNDWKDLAAKLGMEGSISCLATQDSPTDCLLNKIEERNIGLVELKAMLRSIDREDCVREVSQYITDCDPADIPSESSKVPTENEHMDSSCHRNRNLQTEESSWTESAGRRNLHTEESSWTESSGFKSKSLSTNNSPSVHCLHDNDMTLSKSLFSH